MSASATRPSTSGPTASSRPSTARSTCSTWWSATSSTASPSSSEPADEIVVSETAGGVGLGLSVCYDLRFPELYRILALRGARIVTVPANFTRITGEAHWEILLRARAIENQVFVIAPGQGNRPGPEGDSYGNSMIIDPWGEVLARAPAEGAVAISAELDLARQDEIREKLPSLANRVAAAYRWPADAELAANARGAALAAGSRSEGTG